VRDTEREGETSGVLPHRFGSVVGSLEEEEEWEEVDFWAGFKIRGGPREGRDSQLELLTKRPRVENKVKVKGLKWRGERR
jgi:hypothetical protein